MRLNKMLKHLTASIQKFCGGHPMAGWGTSNKRLPNLYSWLAQPTKKEMAGNRNSKAEPLSFFGFLSSGVPKWTMCHCDEIHFEDENGKPNPRQQLYPILWLPTFDYTTLRKPENRQSLKCQPNPAFGQMKYKPINKRLPAK